MFLSAIIILVVAVLLSILTIVLVNRKPRLKLVFQLVYAIVIIILGYLLFDNIMEPIRFKQERTRRENATVERLKDIRKAQESFKDKYGKYTGSFDTLITFIKTDSFELEKIVQVQPWDQDEISRADALKKGILRRSVIKKSVRDSLFIPEFVIDELRFIPFTSGKEFVIGAGEVETGSQVKVQVFEAYALYDDLFNGMDRQEVINYKDERYKITEFEGVKVGSLDEANNNAGNWEK
jgi:hypothetical protein